MERALAWELVAWDWTATTSQCFLLLFGPQVHHLQNERVEEVILKLPFALKP